MILFFGIPSEPPLQCAIAAARDTRVPHAVLNQRALQTVEFTFHVDGAGVDGLLTIGGQRIPLPQLTGVYTRAVDPSELPECRPARRPPHPPTLERTVILCEALTRWLEIAPCPVLNRVRAMATNASKPLQAQLIAASGFLTPPTLVTSSPEQAREFLGRHGRVVFKSISSIRSIVTELTPDWLDRLGRLRSLPVQFQRRIPGHDIRVHVVGERVFATRIACEAVDYRYGGREGHTPKLAPCKLPDDVSGRCVRLAQELGLPFCGIDLRLTPEGDWYCFEVNPSPAYTYYEQATGQRISRAVVDYLSGRPAQTPGRRRQSRARVERASA